MDLKDFLIKELIKAKISSPRLEASIILDNFAKNFPVISIDEEKKIKEALFRRVNHEPLDKIIGKKEFYKYEFIVNHNVLSPRPDTEILVESALDLIDKDKRYDIIDLGTGSGCILLSILKERENAYGKGVDISLEAINVAKKNAKNLGISDRVEFINKSWNELCDVGMFDIIVSNPPYIPTCEFLELDVEVKNFDPKIALTSGDTGFECYEDIALIAPKLLKKDGYIFLEVGYNQAHKVAQIFVSNGFELKAIVKDLADINRCVILKK